MSRPVKDIKEIKGDRLKFLIDRENLFQKDLAHMLKCSQQLISGIINHKQDLTENTAIKLNRIFPQYGVSWLMGADIEFSDSKINELLAEITPAEIATQIENDNLSNWCREIRSGIRRWLCDRA